jgi:hypothetical protein
MLQVQTPYQQFFDLDGTPLDNGSIYIGVLGQNPETNPIAIFWDEAGAIPAQQPLKTSNGYAVRSGTPSLVFASDENYSLTVKDTHGRIVVTTSSATIALGFLQLGVGAVPRTMVDKVRESVSVKDFGADPSGLQDSSNGFQLAGNESPIVYVSGGVFLVNTAPTFSTPVTFLVHSDAALTGPGGVAMGYTETTNEQYLQVKTTEVDFASVAVRRNASHVGGTPGNVSCGIRSDIYVGPDVDNFEWSILGRVYNEALDGENVGVYGQGIRAGIGATWAGVFEAIDLTDLPDPTKGLVGIEVDVRANGTDINKNRVGIDLVITKQDLDGSPCEATYGYRTSNGTGDTDSYFSSSFAVTARSVVGFDTAEGIVTSAAFRMAQGQGFAFDSAIQNQLSYDGVGIHYKVAGATQIRLDADGSVSLNAARFKITGSWSSGAQAPTLGANKPGTTGGGPDNWASIIIDGVQFWIPVWAN